MKKRRRVVRLFKSPINWGAFFKSEAHKPTYLEGTIRVNNINAPTRGRVRSLKKVYKSERNE